MALKTTTGSSSTGTNSPPESGSNAGPPKTNTGAIAGGIVGGVVAVALCLLGAAMLRGRYQQILSIFPRMKSPSTSDKTPEKDGSPAELMGHNLVNQARMNPSELPAEEVAIEIDTVP